MAKLILEVEIPDELAGYGRVMAEALTLAADQAAEHICEYNPSDMTDSGLAPRVILRNSPPGEERRRLGEWRLVR